VKRKLVLTLGVTGVLALSTGVAKGLQSTEVFALNEQPNAEEEQTDTNNGDQDRVVTIKEQEIRENMLNREGDLRTVITREEQEMVENISAEEGFIPQENGTGFFFEKENKK
jgi:hypothetical protein